MHRITTLRWTAVPWALINVWKFSNICINRIGFTQFPQNIKAAADTLDWYRVSAAAFSEPYPMQHIAFPYYGNYNINKKSKREDKAMTCQIDLYAGLLGCGKTTLIKKLTGSLS